MDADIFVPRHLHLDTHPTAKPLSWCYQVKEKLFTLKTNTSCRKFVESSQCCQNIWRNCSLIIFTTKIISLRPTLTESCAKAPKIRWNENCLVWTKCFFFAIYFFIYIGGNFQGEVFMVTWSQNELSESQNTTQLTSTLRRVKTLLRFSCKLVPINTIND